MLFRTILALLCLTLPATAQSEFAGKYAGKSGSYRWSATIVPNAKGFDVKVSVGSQRPACLGELETTGVLIDGQIVTAAPEKGDDCKLVIARRGKGISVKEDKCSSWHGAACEFTSDMVRQK